MQMEKSPGGFNFTVRVIPNRAFLDTLMFFNKLVNLIKSEHLNEEDEKRSQHIKGF